MQILHLISKILPEGIIKDILRYPAYAFLNKLRFVKNAINLYPGIIGIFYFLPNEKPEEIAEINGYLKKYIPKKGDTVIDCGAYAGYFAVLAAKLVGETGRVIAIEPDFFNRALLRKNIKANHLNNVTIIDRGLSDTESIIGWSVGGIVSQAGKSKIFKVKTTTLNKVYHKLHLNRIDFVKMDIEGAEINALNGANDVLKYMQNLAIASYHIVNGKKTCFEVEKLLRANSFKTETKNSAGQLITFGRNKLTIANENYSQKHF